MKFGLSSIAAAAAIAILGSTSARATIVTPLDAVPKPTDFIAYPTGEVLADQTTAYELNDPVAGDAFATGTLRSTVFRESDGTLSFLYRVGHDSGDSSIEYEGYFLDGFDDLPSIDAYTASPTGDSPDGFPATTARYLSERGAYNFIYRYPGNAYDVLIKTGATEFALTGTFTVTGDADGRVPDAYDEDALTVYAPGASTPVVPLPPAVIPGALMIGGVVGGTLLRRYRAARA